MKITLRSSFRKCVELVDELMDLRESNANHTKDAELVVDALVLHMQTLSQADRKRVLHYWDCRKKGTSKRLAEMFATGDTPRLNTDVEFLKGHANGNQFEGGPLANKMGDFYRSVAESEGQSTKGKVYLSGLAAYAGDPRAWVSDRHEAQKVLEERGWHSDGLVDVKAQE